MKWAKKWWGVVVGVLAALAVAFVAAKRRAHVIAKAKHEVEWAEREAARLLSVREQKLKAIDKDDVTIRRLEDRARFLSVHAKDVRRTIETADDRQLEAEMRRLGILLALIAAAWASPVMAQDVPRDCAPEVTEYRGERFELHGLSGWWFRGEVTRCLVASFAEVRLLKEELSLVRDQMRLRSNQLKAYQDALDAAVTSEIQSRLALDEAKSALEASEGSPWETALVGGLGFVIGAVATVAIVFAVGG